MSRSLQRDAKVRRMLVEARKKAGLTQADVAEGLGRSRSYIAMIESGAIGLYLLDFLTLSEILHFDAAEFLMQVGLPGEAADRSNEGRAPER